MKRIKTLLQDLEFWLIVSLIGTFMALLIDAIAAGVLFILNN